MQQYQSTPDYYRDYMQHGFTERAHKYISKYMGKNGKWVYVYGKASGAAKNAAGQVQNGYSQLKDQISSLLPGLQKSANKVANKAKGKYYSGKSKAQEKGTKLVRNVLYGYGHKNPSVISYKHGTSATPRNDSGKVNSHTGSKGSKLNAGTEAGRKRAKKAATTKKFNQLMNRKAFPSDSNGYDRSYASSFRTKNKNGVNRKYINPRAGSTRGQGYSSSIGSADNNKATNKYLRNKSASSRARKNRKAK